MAQQALPETYSSITHTHTHTHTHIYIYIYIYTPIKVIPALKHN